MTNKDLVRLFFKSGYYDNNYEETLKILAEDYYDHSPAVSRSNTSAIYILKIVQDCFPDMRVAILDLIEENNKVACRLSFTATHTKEYMGIAPTGKQISWEAIEIFKIQDGKISESWGYWPDEQIYASLKKAQNDVAMDIIKMHGNQEKAI